MSLMLRMICVQVGSINAGVCRVENPPLRMWVQSSYLIGE